MFEGDREARYRGEPPAMIPVVAPEGEPSALPTADSYEWFTTSGQQRAPSWRNECTLRSVEMFIEYEPGTYLPWISPTPLLMVVAAGDHLTVSGLSIDATSGRASRSGSSSSPAATSTPTWRTSSAPVARPATGSSSTSRRGSPPSSDHRATSVIVPSAADGASHAAEQHQDDADDQDDDAKRPENGDLEQESCDEQYEAENDHGVPLT